MRQKLPVNSFVWIKDIYQFNEDFVKNYNEENDEGHFSKLMVSILKNYMNFIMVYHFYLRQ